MTNSLRIKIIKEVNKIVKNNHPYFLKKTISEREIIQDKYISKLSEKYGYSLSDFFDTDDDLLNKFFIDLF